MPLFHLRVLDLTQVRSGPTCTRLLADFGAEVIRIERPGEPGRAREAFDAVDLHRGKKSILLDLGKPEGLDVILRLVPSTDGVVELFAGASAAEWVERPNAAGAACGPIDDVGQVCSDPQVQQAHLVEEVHHPVHGPMRVLGQPVALHRTPAKGTAPSPLPGQHTREVLGRAGGDAALAERLLAAGIAAESRA